MVVLQDKNGLDFFQSESIMWRLGFGFVSLVRGSYWVFNASQASSESDLYNAMHSVFPLSFWGLPFMFAGIILIISGFLTPYYQTNRNYHRVTFWGYLIATPFYYLFSVAGFNNGLNILTPLTNFAFAIVCGCITYKTFKILRFMKKDAK